MILHENKENKFCLIVRQLCILIKKHLWMVVWSKIHKIHHFYIVEIIKVLFTESKVIGQKKVVRLVIRNDQVPYKFSFKFEALKHNLALLKWPNLLDRPLCLSCFPCISQNKASNLLSDYFCVIFRTSQK
jgi:hypothetical protein